jgi:2-polyprenyl-6-hydroxyphenyl methylase/3-demethylubiquinone-9 3-methyltransferase
VGLDVEAQARYGYLASRIRHHLQPPASIIELGAAPGDQIAQLADLGYAASAVDIGVASDGWSSGSEGRMLELLTAHGVTYHEWDLEKVPYPLPEAAYDGVLFTEVFEHLRDYPVTSLHEVVRILRPGGYLFFSTPNAASLVNRLRVLRGGSTYTPMADWVGGVIHARHAREYLFAEIDDIMRSAGLTVLERESRHFHVADDIRWRSHAKSVLDRIARRWPTLGPQILIVARKP